MAGNADVEPKAPKAKESIAKGSNASSVPLNPPSRLLLRQRQMGAKVLVSKDLQIQMQSPWPKDTSGEVGATGSDLRIAFAAAKRGGPRGWQHYEVTRFGLQKHVAILAGTTTVRLLSKAFLSVFQGSS